MSNIKSITASGAFNMTMAALEPAIIEEIESINDRIIKEAKQGKCEILFDVRKRSFSPFLMRIQEHLESQGYKVHRDGEAFKISWEDHY